ncbi:MAG: aldo/keto reductase [Terrimonas sp.]|nr:aldo/keto reductase [Terrimonas sp.]OJY80985.1 MAG: hypothetical protein BGP13_03690 [Sphingobacteriales bacterium 40-81]
MKTTFIPALNKSISQIGLGCVTFGREIDDLSSYAIMDYAFDKGVTLFDTAAVYSAGLSEEIVEKWFEKNNGKTDSIALSTKILPPFEKGKLTLSIEQSLTRTKQQTIDILFVHSWYQSIEDAEVLQELNELLLCGKIRAIGVSNFNAKQLQSILDIQLRNNFIPVSFVQNNHNIAISDVDDSLLQLCEKFAINIITYSPLGAGFLTGKYRNAVNPGVRFEIIPGHKDIYFNEEAWRRLDILVGLADAKGKSSIELALAWALGFHKATSVLVGCRSIHHLDQALAALSVDAEEIFKALPMAIAH